MDSGSLIHEQKGSNFCLCSHRCLKFNQKSKILLLKVKVSFNRSHRLCIILKVNEKENNNIAEVEDDDIVIICFMISTLLCKDTGPNVEDFQKLLDNNMSTFHITRTAGKLHNHWRLLRHYQLLNCQTGLQFLLKLFEFCCCFFFVSFFVFSTPSREAQMPYVHNEFELVRASMCPEVTEVNSNRSGFSRKLLISPKTVKKGPK